MGKRNVDGLGDGLTGQQLDMTALKGVPIHSAR